MRLANMEAGPSSRPYGSEVNEDCGRNCPMTVPHGMIKRAPRRRLRPRQASAAPSSSSFSSSSSGYPSAAEPVSTSPTTTGIFVGPSSSSFSMNSSYPIASSSSSSSTSSYVRYTGTVASGTISLPWSATTRTTAGSSKPSFVPGVILNLTLAGTSETQAVYSVPMSFGHSTSKRAAQKRKSDWDGSTPQTVELQVDLGSSDLWVASDVCTTSSCSGVTTFNSSASLDSGVNANITYQSGFVSGDIDWEEVSIGGFGIGYQAFISADTVTNEDLSGGNFVGVLGLALPSNSIILSKVPGTTSSDPDGATFLDNLFGSGSSAPSNRFFSLSLARREDVRTTSTLGIGTFSTTICPAPCNLTYVPIIAQPSLGITGYLHWRVPVTAITVDTFSNAQAGTGMTSKSVTLGPSKADTEKTTPLAVFDSGGVAILVGYRPYLDAVYSVAGISMSSDGLYRFPCTTPLSLTFTIGGQKYPVHPLDMSWPDPSDMSQTICIGALQYSSSLGNTGDFILGSSFLKNVYSIYQYPDVTKQTIWQPTVGLYSLINASVASQDFYSVRTLRQSLTSVSSAQESVTAGTNPTSPSSQATNTTTSSKGLAGGIIAAIAIVSILALAVGAFCLWWFWYRRKSNSDDDKPLRGHHAENSISSMRSKKHQKTARQKSMVEGYSDFEGDSWLSGTEGTDSIRLGYIPELVEDKERGRMGERDSVSLRDSSVANSEKRGSAGSSAGLGLDGVGEGGNLIEMDSPVAKRDSSARDPSPSYPRSVSFTTSPLQHRTDLAPQQSSSVPPPNAYTRPQPTSRHSSKSLSMSMQGPFPSPSRLQRNDFFDLIPEITPAGGGSGAAGVGTGRGRRRGSAGGESVLGRKVSPSPAAALRGAMTAEPEEI